MDSTLLVMAAGVGSRYGGLKQLEPIGEHGEGIIDYSVFDALRAGFQRIVFVIRRDIEGDFRRIIGSKHERRTDVRYAFQELEDLPDGFSVPPGREKPWGTAHAVLAARPQVEGPFAVINGDDFYGADAYRVLGRYLREVERSSTQYAMVGYDLANTLSDYGTVSRGVCVADAQGNLRQVVERLNVEKRGEGAVAHEEDGSTIELSGREIVSMNMFGFTPAVFDQLCERFLEFLGEHGRDRKAEFLLPREVDALVSRGAATVKVLRSTATWFGITYREDREHVVRSIRELAHRGLYPTPLG